MATNGYVRVTLAGGERFRLSSVQRRALSEPRYSFTEAYADMGTHAGQVMAALAARELFKATSKGWQRTALGTRVSKELAKRNGGSK